jgi:putative inorganic carbon (hco3(-)) transporter
MKEILIYLYMVALLIRPQDWVLGLVGLPTGDLLIPLGLLLGFTNVLADRENFRMPHNTLMPIYLAVIFISTWLSAGGDAAIDQTNIFLKRVLVFFMTVWILHSKEAIQKAVTLFKLLALFLAYQAILQAMTGVSWGGMTSYPGYDEIRVRWFGDWDGPNVFGLLFVIATTLSFEYIFGQHSLIVRVSHIFFCAAYFAAIYFTNSRGAVLSVACALLFFFYMKTKSIRGIVAAALCIAALLMLGPSRMQEVHSGESSAHERTWLWEQGLHMLAQNPMLGVGRGQFAKRVDLKLIAHNNYVQNFSELGLVGFFFFSCILWLAYKGSYVVGYCSPDGDSPLSAVGRSVCCALVGYCACTFFVVMELDLFYWLLGLAVATYLVGRKTWQLDEMALEWKTTTAVAGLMAGIIFVVWLAAIKQIL